MSGMVSDSEKRRIVNEMFESFPTPTELQHADEPETLASLREQCQKMQAVITVARRVSRLQDQGEYSPSLYDQLGKALDELDGIVDDD